MVLWMALQGHAARLRSTRASAGLSRRVLAPERRRLLWFAATVISLVMAAIIVWSRGVEGWGLDAYAYWSVDQVHPYTNDVGQYGAFLYGPPLAQLFGVLGHLPWPVFLVGWTSLLIAVYGWMTGRYALVLLGLFPPAILELINGNIHLLLAAAIAVGFRYPWTWSLVLLTKVTPGIGLVWFAVRREWRALAIALAATASIAAVSFVFAPWMWREWFEMLIAESGRGASARAVPIPLVVRLPVALVVVWWGARTDRPWTVPVAAFLAVPAMWWYSSVMLLAIIPIRRMRGPVPEASAECLATTPNPTAGTPAPLTR
jgi:hypothetical protein